MLHWRNAKWAHKRLCCHHARHNELENIILYANTNRASRHDGCVASRRETASCQPTKTMDQGVPPGIRLHTSTRKGTE